MRKLYAFLITFAVITGALFLSDHLNQTTPPGVTPPPVVPPPIQPQISFQDALASVNQNELKTMIFWLCSTDLEGRMSGKKGADAVRDYLIRYCTDLGYDTNAQEFAVQNLNNFKEQGTGRTANVIASLSGNDPALMNETVVVGAHYDHVGYGPSMSRAPQNRVVHPGADDNASGTTALMGAAKVLSKMKGKNKRRIVVIAFSGEEMGLVGSKYYVSNPKYSGTVFMLNMDMVGRLKGKTVIEAIGANSSPEIKRVLDGITGYPFTARISGGGGGGSDQAPFYQSGIPVCFLHTGMHDDYHTPSDTAEKIDLAGLTWVSKYAAHVTWEMANLPVKPTFRGEVKEIPFLDHDRRK